MDFLIRDVDSNVIEVLDSRAKKLNRSRNQYLNELLTAIAHNDIMKDERADYNRTLGRVADAMEQTYERLEGMEKNFEKLYLLQIQSLGLSLKDAEQMLSSMITYESEGE